MRAKELLEHYQLGERDFRGVNLRGIYLRDVCLRGINLSCADLRGASLMSVDFSGANLHRADLRGAFLIHDDLSCANLTQAHLNQAFLILTNLHQSCLTDANLSHTNLTSANLSEVSGFAEAMLDQIILTGALLPQRSHRLQVKILQRVPAISVSIKVRQVYEQAINFLNNTRLSGFSSHSKLYRGTISSSRGSHQ